MKSLAKKKNSKINYDFWPTDNEGLRRLIAAATDKSPVTGLTHNFYRYPARFSPKFIREVISAFTEPGDWVFDPFMGGGTTLVEALALGRNGFGNDISTLANFVSSVKTTLYSEAELQILKKWGERLSTKVNMQKNSAAFQDWADKGYHKHLNHPLRWRLRKSIEQALTSAIKLNDKKLENFARCVVLKTAQWALDGRKTIPSVPQFRKTLITNLHSMIEGATALRLEAKTNAVNGRKAKIHCFNRTTVGAETEKNIKKLGSPRLVLTSPPYPGVHVLYHRWQVDGRKETAAPFWIANKLDGSGSSYYTLGDRKAAELCTYFENLGSAFTSVKELCDKDTTIVQVVAFSEPEWQLPRYLETMEDAGYYEIFLPTLIGDGDSRLWRDVPNRKWYADQLGETGGSKEVVLFHRVS